MSEAAILQTNESLSKPISRRDAILDAAQNVFTEKGFELATIQDVAASCSMSAGNIYRYFASKSAIVSGLVERDRAEMAARFAELAAIPDQVAGFEALGRPHMKDECSRHAKLTLEIWAAASRRPELRDLCMSMEATVIAGLDDYIKKVAAEGKMAPGVDPSVVSHLIMALAQALFRDAALKPDHNIDRDLDIMFATIRAAFAGHIQPSTFTA
jgi:TetR/AcrR family transcriptional regulator, repressor for uid operon